MISACFTFVGGSGKTENDLFIPDSSILFDDTGTRMFTWFREVNLTSVLYTKKLPFRVVSWFEKLRPLRKSIIPCHQGPHLVSLSP